MLGEEEHEESSGESENAIGEALTEEVLERTFKDLMDSDRCDRIAGPRVAEHFVVKVRGCERNKEVAGDRLDYARGSFVGATVEAWRALHFPTHTKDFNLKFGEAAAGKLAAEWCRNNAVVL